MNIVTILCGILLLLFGYGSGILLIVLAGLVMVLSGMNTLIFGVVAILEAINSQRQ